MPRRVGNRIFTNVDHFPLGKPFRGVLASRDMPSPEPRTELPPVPLWQTDTVVCTSRTLDDGRIEIALTFSDAQPVREIFDDLDLAVRYAIDRMRAFNGS